MNSRLKLSALFLAASLLSGCVKDAIDPMSTDKPYSRVLTIMCLGNSNGLASSLAENIRTVCNNPIPLKSDTKAILVYEHYDKKEPLLTRLYSDWRGETHRDTLMVLPANTVSTTPEAMAGILSFVQENFPSDHYGLLLSSHGTGWLPKNYYYKYGGHGPRLNSFGAEGAYEYTDALEIDLTDLPECIPFHCDYIIFDACLMGGVEVAYEMKDKADALVFSATEILSKGYQYDYLIHAAMKNSDYALEDFCRHFYEVTDESASSSDRSCTISCIRTNGLESLAEVCKPLFARYRDNLMHLGPNDVQGFFRDNKQWFFDLEDMLVKAGISSEEREALELAIEKCVSYCAHTDVFLGVPINTYCGLSSYLTGAGNDYLDGYYSTLAWNLATEYVVARP